MSYCSSSKKLIEEFLKGDKAKGRSTNVYYNGNICYSYGEHFILAKRLDNNVILINNKRYSKTTNKHQHIMRSCCNTICFEVPSMEPIHKENIEYYIREIKKLLSKTARSRTNKAVWDSGVQELSKELSEYINIFKLRV